MQYSRSQQATSFTSIIDLCRCSWCSASFIHYIFNEFLFYFSISLVLCTTSWFVSHLIINQMRNWLYHNSRCKRAQEIISSHSYLSTGKKNIFNASMHIWFQTHIYVLNVMSYFTSLLNILTSITIYFLFAYGSRTFGMMFSTIRFPSSTIDIGIGHEGLLIVKDLIIILMIIVHYYHWHRPTTPWFHSTNSIM